MKLLVISDTLEVDKSIIPFSLRLAKSMNIQVKVLHIIDRRLVRGSYSAYADSQTVSIGVETFEETLKKELGIAENFLGKMISRESSVLNFPLRVETEVTEDTVEDRLIAESRKSENSVILIASSPEGRFWQDYRDITFVANRLRCPVLLAPRMTEFKNPQNIRINRLTNWAETGQLNKVLCFLGEMGIESEAIERSGPIQKFDPGIQTDADLLVVMQNRPYFLKKLFSIRLSTVLIKNKQIPILLVNFRIKKKPNS
jgi:hypothetical protein